MKENELLLRNFYDAFARCDWKAMQTAYADEAVFVDPVFANLNAFEVRAMWQMLCSGAKDFSLKIHRIECDSEPYIGPNGENFFYCTADWEADYLFSATNKKVNNKVRSYIKIFEGKIAEQSDKFNFYRWSRQALGFKGWLFGMTSPFRRAVTTKARNQLGIFIDKNYPE